MPEVHEITLLLQRIDDRQPGAMDELMRIVYDDLERMAASYLRQQFGDRVGQITLEPAALVNEAFLRLIKQRKHFDNRGQFFAIATKIMLRVLIDYQRQKLAAKRGRGVKGDSRLTLMLEDPHAAAPDAPSATVSVEDLATALDRLESLDARKAEIVKMRVVWGMTVPEVAEALEISPSSVDRDWRFAKAWIADEVGLTH
ncbi:MAG: ECF-type sigma factor [Phycisphaerales bacterium]|nr:ECF-type sigma factor [Phycisphaerales bacterium]